MKLINYTYKNSTKTFFYDNGGVFKLKCNCDTFYIGKTDTNFKTKYNEHILKIKLKNTILNSNFARHDLENNHTINFDINKNLEI